MNYEAWVVVGITCVVFVLLAATRIAPHLVLMGAVVVLTVSRILPVQDALSGFSNEGMITVATLFVVVAGLKQTGTLVYWTQRILGHPRTVRGAQARLSLPVMFISVFVNNTPLVALLIPVVVEWAKTIRISASKLLIPLTYAASLGGFCSLLGTSTNLVVNGLLIQSGRDGLALFDITWVGLPVAAAGMLVLLLLAPHWLPDRDKLSESIADPRQYTTELTVVEGGPLVGKTIQEVGLRHLAGVYLMEIDRRGHVLAAVRPDEVLEGNDQLIFVGMVDAVADLQRIPGLAPATTQVFKLDSHRAERVFAEAVVSSSSPLVGNTIREGRFRTRYNAVVLAVSRSGKRIHQRIGDIALQPGDSLFLETTPSFVEQERNTSDFFLVSKLDNGGPPTREQTWIAFGILVGMVVLAAIGILSMLQAALVAASLMLITRCCSEEAARRSIDLPLLLAIVGSFGLGRTLELSGAASMISGVLLDVAGTNPWVALAAIYGITSVVTSLVTNNAAAVIMFPIAVATADGLGVSHIPFVISLMISASADFATPIGYQTNLMVYAAGGYRFFDFFRIGFPITLALWVATVLVAPIMWPF